MFTSDIHPQISSVISDLDITSISANRKLDLDLLAKAIQNKIDSSSYANIIFICTHNSRRSILSEAWCNALALNTGIKNLKAYSGGTESTAVFSQSLKALNSAGFITKNITEGDNPKVEISCGDETNDMLTFSKVFDHESNPSSDFIAVMTCDSANEACPLIPNASDRIALTYKDPKAFDNTPEMADKYKECSHLIATELLYVFQTLKK